ncbi:MAG TPA: hypothetical protein VFX81_06090 [Burkholderiaceae bacterium]|nr:hypothetical protein [Burkholderiaceae bacterium]
MEWLLDLLALAAVIAAVVFLLRPRRRSGCADCAPADKGAETKVSLAELRASARRASGRD